MKRTVIFLVVLLSAFAASADDKPVSFDQLPQNAKSFINDNYKGVKIVLATVDDDLIRPDYNVVLENAVAIQFENDGRLEKIEARHGEIPSGIVPEQIVGFVKKEYPGQKIVSYEVGKKTYEVELSDGIEIKFNNNFKMIELDY